MTIPVDTILDEYILIARNALSADLSQTGPSGSEYPSVIRSRQKGVKPDTPYVVVDMLDIQQEEGWLTDESVNTNDEPVYETIYQVLVNFIVYGGNAIAIANKLEGYFRLPSVRDTLRENTNGSLVNTTQINSIPIQIAADEFLESSSFQVVHNVVDTLVDTVSGDNTIETVDLDGELNRDESESNYLQLDIFETKP